MSAIPARTEVSVTEIKRTSMKAYVIGLSEGGSISLSEEDGGITIRIHRPKVESWGGQALAVMSKEGAAKLVLDLADRLGMKVVDA